MFHSLFIQHFFIPNTVESCYSNPGCSFEISRNEHLQDCCHYCQSPISLESARQFCPPSVLSHTGFS